MDEMTQLRELRADAPVPDRATLAPGRQRLALTASGRTRRRADWRIASLGAAAAITVAAVLGTQLLEPAGPAPTARATAASGLDLSGPAETLNRAADALDSRTAPPEPRADQWIYTRLAIGDPQIKAGNGEVGELRYEPDSWIRYGNTAAEKDRSDDDRSAREIYRAAADLPEDPATLLAEVRRLYPSDTEDRTRPESKEGQAFRGLSVLLHSYPLPPSAVARIYRAMATIPGVEITDSLVEDAAGREAVAVTREEQGTNERLEILLSPYDYGYAGMRFVVTEDHTLEMPGGGKGPGQKYTAGDITLSQARTAAAVVDAEGEKS